MPPRETEALRWSQGFGCTCAGNVLILRVKMKAPVGKVLLVDDDVMVREIYGRKLEATGYEVICASDGNEALELADRERPGVIVMDINLPQMSGLAAVRHLKEKETTQTIPVIIITSLADYQSCKEFAKGMGATAFLTKPFSTKQFLAEVQSALGEKQGHGMA